MVGYYAIKSIVIIDITDRLDIAIEMP